MYFTMDKTFLNNTVNDWLVALGVFLGLSFLFWLFVKIVILKLKKASGKTQTDVDDFVIELFQNIKPPFYFFVSLYISARFLDLNDMIGKIIFGIFVIVVVLQAIFALQKVVDYVIRKKILDHDENGDSQDKEAVVKLAGQLVKGSLWVVGILLVLSNLGINITSLIAGLGVGGLAIGLALQSVLGDIFASFSIFTDKPFKVGDFIIIGNDMGTVEKVGVKTTRIRTLEGQELVVPNKDLTETRVNNYGRMYRRRVVFNLGVIYETEAEKLKKIPQLVEEIVKQAELAEFDRCHFKDYGDFSLNFETVYFVDTPDYNKYMDVNQEINLKIFEAFKREGIEFAYPTQVVYLPKGQ